MNDAMLARCVSYALLTISFWHYTFAQDHGMDFRYSPSYWYSAICLPQDPQKTLVSNEGALVYDFGPGPYVRPLTTVNVGIAATELHTTRQWLPSPRIPVVYTNRSSQYNEITTECFSFVRETPARAPASHRRGGITGADGWSTVADSIDHAFRNVAWGTNRAIEYDLPVQRGSSKTVVLGFCESYKSKAGMRVMELSVEGDSSLLFDPYRSAGHEPRAIIFQGGDIDSNGLLRISVNPATTSPDPNVFLNAIWVFPGFLALSPQQVLNGSFDNAAEYYVDCGSDYERSDSSPHVDAIRANFKGPGIPTVLVHTGRTLAFDDSTGDVTTDGRLFLKSRPALRSARYKEHEWQFDLPRGTTSADIVVFSGDNTQTYPSTFPDLSLELKKADSFWNKQFVSQQSKIIVPDTALQHLLDISIRNLYQISENIDGYFQFQPGPSVYRGLWVHDAVWMINTALTLGDSLHALQCLENIFRFQHESGQLQVSAPHIMFRETPLLIYAICRFARTTGDRRWLSLEWNRIQRGIDWLMTIRRSTMNDPTSPNAGLFPPGFGDGGLAGVHAEYASVLWSLIALHEAVHTALWAGKKDDASDWKRECDDLLNTFRKAAARDMRKDSFGNTFLPMTVGDTAAVRIPQRAQWAMCEAIALGGFFHPSDQLVRGTLGMLDSTSVEGLPPNTGWLQDGVWPWFGPFHGIAHLTENNTERAAEILYAVANHACPLGTLVEEQLPRALGTRTSGDVSNATGGALIVELVHRFLAEERSDTLALFPHIPDAWFVPGGTIALNDVPSQFGPVSARCNFSRDGRSAVIEASAPGRDSKGTTVVTLDNFFRHGFRAAEGQEISGVLVCPPGESIRVALVREK